MPNWDLFHSDRLEVERDLSPAQLRAMVSQGQAREDDLVRSAGTADAWRRLGDLPTLFVSETPGTVTGGSVTAKPGVIPEAILLDDLKQVPPRSAGPEPVLMSV